MFLPKKTKKIPTIGRDSVSIQLMNYYFANLTDIFLSIALSASDAEAATVANLLPYPSAPRT